MKSAESRLSERPPDVKEVHILWTPDGMSCDGDTISVTNAEQPSIEDVLLGAIPGLPKVHLHNRVLAYEQGGEDFLEYWRAAAEDRLGAPFILVVEGSIPNEEIKREGYWAALGTDKRTGQPITTCEWIDRLAPRRWPSWRPARVRPTAGSTPWRATRPARWAWPTIWVGTGGRRPAYRSSTSRAVRCNRTT